MGTKRKALRNSRLDPS